MKTLEEVIRNFEICRKARLNLISCDGCTYANEDNVVCINCNETDALYYLKMYRSDMQMWEADRKGLLGWIEQYKEAREKHQQVVIELKKNPLLTLDELKQMEGKPVWVEYMDDEKQTGWALIAKNPERPTFVKPKLFAFVGEEGKFYLTISGYGKTWQAYRKERK